MPDKTFSNGGGHMIKIVLTAAVLGSVVVLQVSQLRRSNRVEHWVGRFPLSARTDG